VNKFKMSCVALFFVLVLFKLIDYCLTVIALEIGAIEINPLGFGLYVIFYNFSYLFALGFCIVFIDNVVIEKGLLFGVILSLLIHGGILFSNICQLVVILG